MPAKRKIATQLYHSAMKCSLLVLLGGVSASLAWLPTDDGRNLSAFSNTGTSKIRGVNLGSSFIIEKWMASGEWSSMGCGDYQSEWGCVQGIGQEAANAAFEKHWQTWIVQDDITKMISYGLNTIRVSALTSVVAHNFFSRFC